MTSISISEARERLLSHFFAPARTPIQLLKRFAAIQIDPIAIVAPNHFLVTSARCGPGTQALLAKSYDDAAVIEIYAKERCLVLREDAMLFGPLLTRRKLKHEAVLRTFSSEIATLRRLARNRGSLSVGDLKSDRLVTTDRWGPKRSATMIVNLLWQTGDLIVASRTGRLVQYRLAVPRMWHLPDSESLTEHELRIRRWTRYLDGVGVTDTRDGFAGFERCGATERRILLTELVTRGHAIPVSGIGGPHVLCVASRRMLKSRLSAASCLPCFIPPLDNFLWHRDLSKDIWNFDYRWEIYTPPSRRTFGPYAMPLVTTDGVSGPVDFRFDRSAGTLIGRFSRSPIAQASRSLRRAAETAAHKLAGQVGAERLSIV